MIPVSSASSPEVVAGSIATSDHIGALLRVRPAARDHNRNLGDAELPRGEDPGVAGDNPPASSASTGFVRPHSFMLAASCAI
jgi:hypothetical protein